MDEVGRDVDVVQRGQLAIRPCQRLEARPRRGGDRSGAPGDALEQARIEAAQAEQHVAAVEARHDHRLGLVERLGRGAQAGGIERRAVGADQQHALAAGEHPAAPRPPCARPGRPRPAPPSAGPRAPSRPRQARSPGAGTGAQLDAAGPGGGAPSLAALHRRPPRRRARLDGLALQRARQHARGERRRPLGAERGNQPRLHPPRLRRLGEDHDAGRAHR